MADDQKKFIETVANAVSLKSEDDGPSEGPWKIEAVGITADKINLNRRLYPSAVLESAVNQLKQEMDGGIRGRLLLGEVEHPSMKNPPRPMLDNVVVNWQDVSFEEGHVKLTGLLLGNSRGKDVRAGMLGGVIPGTSQRAYGTSKIIESDELGDYEEVQELVISAYDLTGDPADIQAGITYWESMQEETEMADEKPKEKAKEEEVVKVTQVPVTPELVKEQYPGVAEKLIEEQKRAEEEAYREKQRREQEQEAHDEKVRKTALEDMREALELGETEDPIEKWEATQKKLAAFEAEQRKQDIAVYVGKLVKELNYPDAYAQNMIDSILEEEPEDEETAKKLVMARKSLMDPILSDIKLRAMGHPGAAQMLGPVLETETGHPEFARASFMLLENVQQRGLAPAWDFRKPIGPNQLFAAQYLTKFDKQYMGQLKREAREFSEAEQTTDLNLPYTVIRAVVAAAFPTLVATGLFDVALTASADARVFYEDYSGETGEEVSVTDEAVTSDEGAWVDMAYKRILPGTVVVEPDGGGTAYTEGDDYAIDYANGRFFTVTAANGGTIGDSTALDVDYDYKAYRLGEMQEIERGKGTLSTSTITCEADRLATQISDEAIKFSRSQLGWDAVARTVSMLIQQVQRRIDQDLMYLALASALSIGSNSGGTWTAGSDTEDELVKFLGVARVLVANRYYMPSGILVSLTNSDVLSNWDGFTAAGSRPDSGLDANGFVGRVKGLPVFESTEFSDSYALVFNREIVHHRIFSAMALLGPFPSYGSNQKLIAADQYYVEEYNGSVSPIEEKASYVKIQ